MGRPMGNNMEVAGGGEEKSKRMVLVQVQLMLHTFAVHFSVRNNCNVRKGNTREEKSFGSSKELQYW